METEKSHGAPPLFGFHGIHVKVNVVVAPTF